MQTAVRQEKLRCCFSFICHTVKGRKFFGKIVQSGVPAVSYRYKIKYAQTDVEERSIDDEDR